MLSKKRPIATLSPEERLLSLTYGSRSFSLRGMKKSGKHVDDPLLDHAGLGIFFLIHEILVQGTVHQPFGFGLHPRGDECGEV